jgi:hypothetical protein
MQQGPSTEGKLSSRVIEALAAEEGVVPTELRDPLYDVIELEALDDLFSDRRDGSPRSEGLVEFAYRNYQVTVHSGGRVDVTESDELPGRNPGESRGRDSDGFGGQGADSR